MIENCGHAAFKTNYVRSPWLHAWNPSLFNSALRSFSSMMDADRRCYGTGNVLFHYKTYTVH